MKFNPISFIIKLLFSKLRLEDYAVGGFHHQSVCLFPIACDGLCHLLHHLFHFLVSFLSLHRKIHRRGHRFGLLSLSIDNAKVAWNFQFVQQNTLQNIKS